MSPSSSSFLDFVFTSVIMCLLCLTYTFLFRQLLKKGDSSIVIAPATDPQDLRPESETPSQRAPTSHAPSKSVSSDVVKVAFAFGQVLRPLPRHQAYVSKACKASVSNRARSPRYSCPMRKTERTCIQVPLFVYERRCPRRNIRYCSRC